MAADTSATATQGLDLDRLTPYLSQHLPLAGALRAELIQGGRSNLTFILSDATSEWVLRRPPLGHVLPSAHDMSREFRVLTALESTDVPAPQPILLCADPDVIGAPFYLMSYVRGPVLRDAADTESLSPAVAARCADALLDGLVTIAEADITAFGDLGRPQGYLDRQVARWKRQWELSATRELPDIERLAATLAAGVPASSGAGLVHGDYRLDNVILSAADENAAVAAVIDWEMATLGDPVVDLGLLIVYWDPVTAAVTGTEHAVSANTGFPTTDELASGYAEATGADLTHLDFYVALGYFKLAVIAEGIHARYLAGQTVGSGFDRVGSAVPLLAARGLAALNT
ncbi:MAG TPA: phosphotransferase family protein [Jatrophihabitantaceae bacterium]|nr:phosphotransferase family protein [Jatrophihabitantaceae bacterium]